MFTSTITLKSRITNNNITILTRYFIYLFSRLLLNAFEHVAYSWIQKVSQNRNKKIYQAI
jgi:hypothetical protein